MLPQLRLLALYQAKFSVQSGAAAISPSLLPVPVRSISPKDHGTPPHCKGGFHSDLRSLSLASVRLRWPKHVTQNRRPTPFQARPVRFKASAAGGKQANTVPVRGPAKQGGRRCNSEDLTCLAWWPPRPGHICTHQVQGFCSGP